MAPRIRRTVMYLPMRVWDAPTRLFHWALVLLIPASYISARTGHFALHLRFGYAMLTLLLFRLTWGVIGSDTARFRRFVVGPLAALRHLAGWRRREPDAQVGHNPAGGWMVLVLLLLLAVQVGSGLFANDGLGVTEGPLARHVGGHASDVLSLVHAANFKLIAAAIVVHLLAIGVYAVVKRQDLVRPMLTGKKRLPAATRAPRLANPWLALLVLALAAGVALLVATRG